MKYSEFCELYERLVSTTKRLEKTGILAEFLPKLKGKEEWVYLLRGRVFADFDERDFGISTQLAIKAMARAAGQSAEYVNKEYKKVGDLGNIAEGLIGHKKQSTLFSSELKVGKVFSNLQKLASIEGKGSIDKKIALVVELLASSGKEAKYIMRTVLNDLRIGVAEGILVDSITKRFFPEQEKAEDVVQAAYDKVNDFAEVLALAEKGLESLKKVSVKPGKPLKVMLPIKVADVEEAFKMLGKPLAVEHKYDGFRVLINYDGKSVSLFTRRLDNVTNQFPDIVKTVKEEVKGKSFIIDSEVIGFDPKKKQYKPFEAISQRIKRKYDIKALSEKLPVEVNVFDMVYHDGKSMLSKPFSERRKLLEKVVGSKQWKIKPAKQFVSDDEKEIRKFYQEALKIGEEGIMMKKLDAPYQPGRRVGFMVKLKPEVRDLDVVIVAAEYGTGKRAGGLTSFYVACKDGDDMLEVGKVSSGLKEKESDSGEGTTYTEMDKVLQPLITKEEKSRVLVKPEVVVSVTYQNIQPSPTYSSGFALRFPRITHYRPERGVFDIATFDDIKKEFKRMQAKRT